MTTRPAQTTSSSGEASVSQIADRSYRGYDGELKTRAARWWIVALATIRANLRKPAFWILAGLVLLFYVINGLVFYFTQNAMSQMGSPAQKNAYAQSLYQCLTFVGLPVFLTALVVGAGSIAADNRANALLVYLAKPITKTDYLLGKWVGVFTMVAAVSFLPALLLYLFFLGAYWSEGFWKENPTLILRLLGATLLPALLHASLIIGFSAWSKRPSLAGALYAGLYFVTLIVSGVAGAMMISNAPNRQVTTRAATVLSLSVDGIIRGTALRLYNAEAPGRQFREQMEQPEPPRPPLLPLLLLSGALVVIPLAAARVKVRAVEVISG